jgi:hypothetical protein
LSRACIAVLISFISSEDYFGWELIPLAKKRSTRAVDFPRSWRVARARALLLLLKKRKSGNEKKIRSLTPVRVARALSNLRVSFLNFGLSAVHTFA